MHKKYSKGKIFWFNSCAADKFFSLQSKRHNSTSSSGIAFAAPNTHPTTPIAIEGNAIVSMPSKINNLPSNISRRIGICSTLIDDIMRIQVEGFEETVRLGKRIPSTTEEAQFNTAWPLAVLLLDGEVGPKQMLETRLKDERVLSLINKIELIESNELSILNRLLWKGDQRGKHASRVKIILLDGREFDSGIVSTPMEYGQNWNEEKVGRKFQWLTGNILVEKVMKQIIDMIWNFEKVNNVSKLTCLLQ